MSEQLSSANFSFLAVHDAQLVRLGALAERYFKDDPNTSLLKLRQYGETLAQLVAAKVGLFRDTQEPQQMTFVGLGKVRHIRLSTFLKCVRFTYVLRRLKNNR